MTYIINPWLIYLIEVLSVTGGVTFALGLIGLIVSLIYAGAVYFDEIAYYNKPDESAKARLKTAKKFMKIFAVIFIIGLILPSKNTMLMMLVAKYATVENVGMTVEGLKDAVDYIVQAIKSLK